VVTTQSLQRQLEDKVQQIEDAVEHAGKAPAPGEWSAREVLTHLAGAEAQTFYEGCQKFVAEDTPRLDITPGDAYMSDSRKEATIDELLAAVVGQYRELSKWVGSLSEADLARTAQLPAFKDTPLGEYPSLGLWIGGIINFHLPDHIQQLQALRK
jgi:hypothetical protein